MPGRRAEAYRDGHEPGGGHEFSDPSVEPAVNALIGRRIELEALRGFIGRAGQPAPAQHSTRLLLGELGSGKTALLQAVAEHAHALGLSVVGRADGESWTGRPLSGLCRLLDSLTSTHPGLDDEAVLEHLTAGSTVRFAGGLATEVLGLLRAAARVQPVVLLVDDADRLDEPSLRVLLFVARRVLPRDQVRIVLAAATARPVAAIRAVTEVVHLAPLSATAAEALLERTPAAPSGRVREDILQAARGNPLALLELSRLGGPRPEGLAGGRAAGFADAVRSMPSRTRHLLLLAAASDGESIAELHSAAGAEHLEDWAAAERAGLVVLDDHQVSFCHPLARTAAYATATSEQRRSAHEALAEFGGDRHRAAWQLAHACTGPDEAVAAALGAAAQSATRRGDLRAAARVWERAAECSPDAPTTLARRIAALDAAYAAGENRWVSTQFAALEQLAGPRQRVLPTLQHAASSMLLADYDRAAEVVAPLVAVVEELLPGEAVLLGHVVMVLADESASPAHRVLAAAVLAGARVPASTATMSRSTSSGDLLWVCGLVVGDRDRARATLHEALEAGQGGEYATGEELYILGRIAERADEVETSVDLLQRSNGLMHDEGPAGFGVGVLALQLIEQGRWREADELVGRWAPLADERRMTRVAVEIASARAILLALRGRPEQAAELVEERILPDAALLLDLRVRWAAALIALVAGEHAESYRLLRGAFSADGAPRHPVIATTFVARLAAAARGPQERRDARVVLDRVRGAVGDRTSPRMRLLLHHAQALLGEDGNVEHHFRLALADPTGDQWPLERAQVRLHYGSWLRLRWRTLEARELLVSALDVFETVGATALVERVRSELRAAGAVDQQDLADASLDVLDELTTQQRQVVQLAAAGLRNREIAEKLFLSPRTVGSHLHHAYPKLGVSGRHQLAGLLVHLT